MTNPIIPYQPIAFEDVTDSCFNCNDEFSQIVADNDPFYFQIRNTCIACNPEIIHNPNFSGDGTEWGRYDQSGFDGSPNWGFPPNAANVGIDGSNPDPAYQHSKVLYQPITLPDCSTDGLRVCLDVSGIVAGVTVTIGNYQITEVSPGVFKAILMDTWGTITTNGTHCFDFNFSGSINLGFQADCTTAVGYVQINISNPSLKCVGAGCVEVTVKDWFTNDIWVTNDSIGKDVIGSNIEVKGVWSIYDSGFIREGCYYIEMVVCGITYKSNRFQYYDANTDFIKCTKFISWYSSSNAFQFFFNTNSYIYPFSIRLEAGFRGVKGKGVKNIIHESTGQLILHNSDMRIIREFVVKQVPVYVHEALFVGLANTFFYVDDIRWVQEEPTYEPAYRKSSILAPVTILLQNGEQNLFNTSCQS